MTCRLELTAVPLMVMSFTPGRATFHLPALSPASAPAVNASLYRFCAQSALLEVAAEAVTAEGMARLRVSTNTA